MIKKVELNRKAVMLRKKGVTYSAILEKVPVAKSTLALWFKEVHLSTPQQQRITKKRLEAGLRGGLAKRNQRIQKSLHIENLAVQEANELMKDPLWLAGVLLYWAEGSKEKSWRTGEIIHFSNMDPEMHRIFIKWATKYLCSKADLYYEIYLHENSDVKGARDFWSKKFQINQKVLKVYFKKDNKKNFRKNTGQSYFGVFRVGIRKSIDLNRKIAGWVKGVVKCL